MILHIQQGLKEDGFTVPMAKLCRWFEVPRRTVYYKPVKSTPKVQERFAEPIKQMSRPSFRLGVEPWRACCSSTRT
jgi:putative transposase